jgi:transglutaminase-like putative cysteine protease
MLVEAKPVQNLDTFAFARNKLVVGPVPDWVISCPPDYDFAPKNPKKATPTTWLLWSLQANTECRASHVHMALRLENMQAVQQESQWRLEFEPTTQSIILHWIKVRRGQTEIDHTHLQKIHLLQREAGLEGCVIDGVFTALLLLEDVRPGDVLEWCYTTETIPRLLSENRFAFYQLPSAVPIGKVHFVVRFDQQRPLKWKSSGPHLRPVESQKDGEVVWRWLEKHFSGAEPDVNTPPWYLSFPWIQISDCSDWGVIARAIISAWDQGAIDTSVESLVEDVSAKEADLVGRVEQAMRLVQDGFRYLSVNLEHGGQIPTPPGTVARRRFGDCKDLSFLLVHVFRRLGVTAHPVLVSSGMRRSIANMLPTPSLFDHVVVEFELQGETRWVDATIKNQGGGPLKRMLPNYGFGLVLSSTSTHLTQPPAGSVSPGIFRIRETILLDTTGANSSVALVTTAEGNEAEILRHYFASAPLEEVSRQRLQNCADRYGQARRIGDLKYRDDRELNEFHIAEVFEINGFLGPSNEPGYCNFLLPPNLVKSSLRLPDTPTRRDPFALPPPCTFIHAIDVQIGGLRPIRSPRNRIDTKLLHFSYQNRSTPGCWSVTFTLTILDEVINPEQYAEHSRAVQEIWRSSTWNLTVPAGCGAPGRNRAFGLLPSPRRVPSTQPSSQSGINKDVPFNSQTGAAKSAEATTATDQSERVLEEQPQVRSALQHESSRRHMLRALPRRKRKRTMTPLAMVVIGFILFLIVFIILIASTGG